MLRHRRIATTARTRAHRGFTLVEVALVASILAVISAIAMPRVNRLVDRARAVAASHMRLVLQSAVEESCGTNGKYPATLQPEWFAHGRLPANPFAPNPAQDCEVESSGDPGRAHPAIKVFTPGGPADTAYWYNPANGIVRARVEDRGDPAETLWLYNLVNGCGLSAIEEVAMEAEIPAYVGP